MPTKPALGATINTGHSLYTNMKGCWLFNEGVGVTTVANLLGGTASLTGGATIPSTSNGNFGGPAVSFAANSIGAVQTGVTATTAAWTMLCWAYVTDVSNYTLSMPLSMSGGSPYALFGLDLHNGPNIFNGAIYSSDGLSANTISMTSKPYATWCQLALVRRGNSSTYELYYNGASTGTASSGTLSLSGTELYVGDRKSFTSQTFEGLVDHAILWERDLSTSEILSLYSDPFQFVSTPTPASPGIMLAYV